MKLYTEEEVLSMLKIHLADEDQAGSFVNLLTPIEIPSDEEIVNKFNAFINTEVDLKFLTKEQGERLKWYYELYLVNKIQGGNK